MRSVPYHDHDYRSYENNGSPSSSSFCIRRLNSDIARSSIALVSPLTPRHRSLPVLSCPPELRSGRRRTIPRSRDIVDNDDTFYVDVERPFSTSPASPNIEFYVGEAVNSAAGGMLSTLSIFQTSTLTKACFYNLLAIILQIHQSYLD